MAYYLKHDITVEKIKEIELLKDSEAKLTGEGILTLENSKHSSFQVDSYFVNQNPVAGGYYVVVDRVESFCTKEQLAEKFHIL